MTRPTANLRLFAAIYPPSDWTTRALALLRSIPLPFARPVPPHQVHMTVQFIGDTPSREMDSVIESVARSAAGIGAFELRAMHFIELPERPPHRLVAIETDAPPPFLELHRRLVRRLARNPREHPSDRFRPHLTLARYERAHEPRQSSSLPTADESPFVVTRVRLMRSTLSPTGATHHEVGSFSLDE